MSPFKLKHLALTKRATKFKIVMLRKCNNLMKGITKVDLERIFFHFNHQKGEFLKGAFFCC